MTVLVVFIRRFHSDQPLVPTLERGLVKREALAPLPGFNYSDSNQTLVIATNAQCKQCIESTGFYNELGKLEKAEPNRIRVVVVFPNTAIEVREYTDRTSLNLSTIPNVDFEKLKVKSTPTIVLVDKGGAIVDFWAGKLTPEIEGQVFRQVRG